jgi:hypothetical protein
VGQLRANEGWLETKDDLRKPRVTLERKITWSATVEGDGGFIVNKAARGRDTRSGGTPRDLAATRCRRFMKIAVSLWA